MIRRIAPLLLLLFLGFATNVDAATKGSKPSEATRRKPSEATRRKLSATARFRHAQGIFAEDLGPANRVARAQLLGVGKAFARVLDEELPGRPAPWASPVKINFRPARTGRPGSVTIDVDAKWTAFPPGKHPIKLWAFDAQGERFDVEGELEVGPRLEGHIAGADPTLDGQFSKATFRGIIPTGRSLSPHGVRDLAAGMGVVPLITWTKAARAR
jgi:hypothetical protein